MFKFINNKNQIKTMTEKSETPSILSKNFQIQGDIKSSGILEIEGKAKGTIKGNLVVIREDGQVEGKIDADILNIHGAFNGDIKANKINIFKKARIIGNIEYKSLSVEDGAYIDGQFKRISTNINEKTNIKVANENQSDDKISIKK